MGVIYIAKIFCWNYEQKLTFKMISASRSVLTNKAERHWFLSYAKPVYRSNDGVLRLNLNVFLRVATIAVIAVQVLDMLVTGG